jgi:hypothetical protein
LLESTMTIHRRVSSQKRKRHSDANFGLGTLGATVSEHLARKFLSKA